MPGPYNPLFYKTYNPNTECWDVLAQFYISQVSNSQSSNADCQNESDEED